MTKRILSIVLLLVMLMSFSLSAFADTGNIGEDGGSASVPIDMSVNATTFSVTVPSTLPVEVMTDGTVAVATDSIITNNSAGLVEVKNIDVEMTNGWKLVPILDDFSTKDVNTKELGLSINGVDAATGNLLTAFTTFAANTSQDFKYEVKLPVQSDSSNSATVGYIVITMGWVES